MARDGASAHTTSASVLDVMVAVAADEGVTCHVMVGFSDSAVGKAETAAVSEATTTTGRAAATATGPLRNVHGTRLAMGAHDRVNSRQKNRTD
jgi:hypothetical protein